MNSGFIYPGLIAEIRMVCSKHVSGLASADDVQRAVQRGEAIIIAIAENDIQRFFTDIEGQLELVKFTIDAGKQLPETQRIAGQVLSWLWERELSGRGATLPPT